MEIVGVQTTEQVCNEDGIPLFLPSDTLPLHTNEKITGWSAYFNEVTVPTFGQIEVVMENNAIHPLNPNTPCLLLDGQGAANVLGDNQAHKNKLYALMISLQDGKKFSGTSMSIEIWLKGRSPKVSALLHDLQSEENGEEEMETKSIMVKAHQDWEYEGQTFESLFLPLDIEVLKDLRVRIIAAPDEKRSLESMTGGGES